jgi:peptide/nickel transport system permease protein
VTGVLVHPRQERRPRRPLLAFTVRRLVASLALLVVVSALTFFAVQLLPGDAADAVAGRSPSPTRLAAIRAELGMDKPLLQRYVAWVGGAAHGDFGRSLTSMRVEVGPLVARRLRNSLELAGLALLLIVPLALLIGVAAGTRAGSKSDHAISASVLGLASVPDFAIGALLSYAFGVQLGWFPPVAIFDAEKGPFSHPSVLVLPVATLTLAGIGYGTRIVRASVAEAMQSDYAVMARLNGIPERVVVRRYALRNALGPCLQALGITCLTLIGGVVVVEVLFNYPGVGQLALDATLGRDFTTLLAVTIVIAAVYLLINLLTDLAIMLATPKLRSEL